MLILGIYKFKVIYGLVFIVLVIEFWREVRV